MFRFRSPKPFFMPLEDANEVKDVNDGEVITEFTYADLKALEELDIPRFLVDSRRVLKKMYGYDHPHQFLRNSIDSYYYYRSTKDRRYKWYKKYGFKNLATLGFTFRFFQKILYDYVKFINSIWRDPTPSTRSDMKRYCQKQLRLVRSDLRSTRCQLLLELARMVKLKKD